MEKISRTAIIGVGLMGGSLAGALRKNNICKEIIGWDREKSALQAARKADIIDTAAPGLTAAVKQTDLVIIAVPTATITRTLEKIYPYLSSSALVMDLGSTKQKILQQAEKIFINYQNQETHKGLDHSNSSTDKQQPGKSMKPAKSVIDSSDSSEKSSADIPGPYFIGGHPIAGSEKSGVEWSNPDMFAGAPFVLTPLSRTPESRVKQLTAILEKLGARVYRFSPADHDRYLAWISHLPQLAASALMQTIAEQPDSQQALELAGSGLRDTTRIAASDAGIWQDIVFSNRENIAAILQDYITRLEKLQQAVKNSNTKAVHQLMTSAARARVKLDNSESADRDNADRDNNIQETDIGHKKNKRHKK